MDHAHISTPHAPPLAPRFHFTTLALLRRFWLQCRHPRGAPRRAGRMPHLPVCITQANFVQKESGKFKRTIGCGVAPRRASLLISSQALPEPLLKISGRLHFRPEEANRPPKDRGARLGRPNLCIATLQRTIPTRFCCSLRLFPSILLVIPLFPPTRNSRVRNRGERTVIGR